MQGYFAVITMILLLGSVITRVMMLRRRGITAMKFGSIDKTDFVIPPFAFLYFYLIVAHAFNLPTISRQEFFHSEGVSWFGVFLCLAGWVFLLWSLISFGRSFRVGIDTETPDKLITTGIFSLSRNPIYVGFAFFLLGQFLVFPNWILLLVIAAGFWLFNRQVLREEDYLKQHYGQEYADYCARVRRYL